MTIQEFCERHDACREGRAWALANCRDIDHAWETLRPDWLVWVATRQGVLDDRTLRLFAVWCARQVQHLMTDQRSLDALDVSHRYAHGEATDEELDAAKVAARDAASAAAEAASAAAEAAWDAAKAAALSAASAAAWAAAWDAACAAAWDAACAAVWAAASDAVWAAASDAAWAAAREAARAAQADWLRANAKPCFDGGAR